MISNQLYIGPTHFKAANKSSGNLRTWGISESGLGDLIFREQQGQAPLVRSTYTIYQHLRWTVPVTLEKNVLPKPLVSATRFRFPVLQRSLKTKHWKKCPEKAHLPKHDFGVTSFNECFISDTSQSPQSPIPSELKSRAATATSWEITDVQCNHMQSMQK